MEDITTRVIVIAVNIFVTIAIVSLVIIMFFQMQDIYGVVAKTNTSIYERFNNVYSMYNGRTMTGLGLLNTIKKYESKTDQNITVSYPGSGEVKDYALKNNIRESVHLKSLMENEDGYKYENKYNVTVETSDNGQITIRFY